MSKAQEEFGRLAFEALKDCISNDCCDCSSETLAELAIKAGLMSRVPYDPDKHGPMQCDPGDPIFWWAARKTIAEHALDVLRETNNEAVMWGDSGILDEIAARAGIESSYPTDRWKRVLDGLERSDKLEKTHTRSAIRNRLVRCFRLTTKL